MYNTNIAPFEQPNVFAAKDRAVDESFRWMRAALAKAREDADEALQWLRLRERVCRAELKGLYVELARCARDGGETVTLEVQIQRRVEETTLCRHQAQLMSDHLSALTRRLNRAEQFHCVN